MIGLDLLLALHLIGAAAWVGGMAFALLVLRPSLAVLDGPQRLALHREVFRRFFRMVWHVMPIVLLTGYAMLFGWLGGFAHVGWPVHVMHLLGWVMTAVFLAIVFGPWRTMRAAPSAEAVERIRRLVMLNLLLGTLTLIVAGFLG